MTFYNQINNQFSTAPANFDQDYYDYFTPAIHFEANDIYTPQPKETKEYVTNDYVTIDVENLIDYNSDDTTLEDFFSIDDVANIPDYYDLDNCFSAEDIASIPPDLSPLDKLKQELDEFTAWLKQSELKKHSDMMRQAVAA